MLLLATSVEGRRRTRRRGREWAGGGRVALASGPGLGGSAADDLVEQRLALLGAKLPAEPLDVLAGGGTAADDDRDPGVWNVDALVQNAAGDQLAVATGPKSIEHQPALVGWGAVGDGRDGEAPADRIDHRDVLGEHDHPVGLVARQQLGH